MWWLALAAVLVFWMLGAYNRLVSLRNAIGSAWQQVDEVLQRRAQAVAQLVAAVRDELVGEEAALDALLAAQAQVAASADGLRQRPVVSAAAEALVRAESGMAAAAARVLALIDLQPGLSQADAVAPHLQALREAEPQLVFVRQLFNDAAQAYNAAARQWPTRLVARLYGFGTAGCL
jgi:LemA protein